MPVKKMRIRSPEVEVLEWTGHNLHEVVEFVSRRLLDQPNPNNEGRLFLYSGLISSWVHVPLGAYIVKHATDMFSVSVARQLEEVVDAVQ